MGKDPGEVAKPFSQGKGSLEDRLPQLLWRGKPVLRVPRGESFPEKRKPEKGTEDWEKQFTRTLGEGRTDEHGGLVVRGKTLLPQGGLVGKRGRKSGDLLSHV